MEFNKEQIGFDYLKPKAQKENLALKKMLSGFSAKNQTISELVKSFKEKLKDEKLKEKILSRLANLKPNIDVKNLAKKGTSLVVAMILATTLAGCINGVENAYNEALAEITDNAGMSYEECVNDFKSVVKNGETQNTKYGLPLPKELADEYEFTEEERNAYTGIVEVMIGKDANNNPAVYVDWGVSDGFFKSNVLAYFDNVDENFVNILEKAIAKEKVNSFAVNQLLKKFINTNSYKVVAQGNCEPHIIKTGVMHAIFAWPYFDEQGNLCVYCFDFGQGKMYTCQLPKDVMTRKVAESYEMKDIYSKFNPQTNIMEIVDHYPSIYDKINRILGGELFIDSKIKEVFSGNNYMVGNAVQFKEPTKDIEQ